MTVTKSFVDSIKRIRFEDFPDSTIKIAKMAILDNVGNILGAHATKVGSIYMKVGQDRSDCCTILGTNKKTSLMEASFINGSLAQVLDYDDTFEIESLAVSHPGPAVVTAALTTGERQSSSGRDLLKAVILGYEAAIRVAKAIEPRKDEFWGFSNTQIIGAVTAASILLGLDNEKMLHAYGAAVSCAPLPNTNMMWGLAKRPMSWVRMVLALLLQQG